MTKHYLTATETAKLVRTALKSAFPGVKFSITTKHHTSVRVTWKDGPSSAEVKKIACQYEGGSFDAMIDLATHNEHYLLPDGSVILHRGEIGHSYGEIRGADKCMVEGAKLVSFGANYIFCTRLTAGDWGY